MAKKILLASGCSYTDKQYKSNDPLVNVDWPMWPEILADHLDLKCVNTGKSGQGADHIFDSIIEGIETYKKRVDTVAILWTGSDRLPFFNFTLNPLVEIQLPYEDEDLMGYNPFKWMDDIGIGSVSKKYFNSEHFARDSVYKQMILSPLKKMSTVIKLCEHHNIKLVMGQGLMYFDYHNIADSTYRGKLPERCAIDFSEVFKIFSKNPFFAHLDQNKKHIIGWPFFKQLKGYSFDDLRYDPKLNIEEWDISAIDSHPNKIGQELFANQFKERYDELYSL